MAFLEDRLEAHEELEAVLESEDKSAKVSLLAEQVRIATGNVSPPIDVLQICKSFSVNVFISDDFNQSIIGELDRDAGDIYLSNEYNVGHQAFAVAYLLYKLKFSQEQADTDDDAEALEPVSISDLNDPYDFAAIFARELIAPKALVAEYEARLKDRVDLDLSSIFIAPISVLALQASAPLRRRRA